MKRVVLRENDLSPAGFVMGHLGWGLYDWQIRMLNEFVVPNVDVVALCVNGSGKTSHVGAGLVVWHCVMFPNSQVVVTSGGNRQVKTQMWPRLTEVARGIEGMEVVNSGGVMKCSFPNGSEAYGFATDEGGLFEGYHGAASGRLLVILDEAKSISESVYQAVERCRIGTKEFRLLVMSSAGAADGRFYEMVKGGAKKGKKVYTIYRSDCPHITEEAVERTAAEYGENHPITRSLKYNEFMGESGYGNIIEAGQLERLLNDPPVKVDGVRCAFMDFAAGGDENALCVVNGNFVEHLITWKEQDTMTTCTTLITHLLKMGLKQNQVFADAGGIGKPMMDRLEQLGWRLGKVYNQAKAVNEEYHHTGAEMWYEMAGLVASRECVLVDDAHLVRQLTNRRMKLGGKRLSIESKLEMRQRGLQSPDRADAVVGAFYVGKFVEGGVVRDIFGQDAAPRGMTGELNERLSMEKMAGFWAG